MRLRKSTKARQNRTGPLNFIVGCFVASALIRLVDPQSAIAKEIQSFAEDADAMTASAGAGEPGQIACEAPGPLMIAIRERDQQLDDREAGLASQLQTLRVAEIRLQDQLSELKQVEKRLSDTLARADGAAEADIVRLTAVYESMKPKSAASLFEAMDVEFAAGFLSRMRPEKAADIMALIKSETAYAVSAVIAGRNARAPTE